MYIMMYKPYTH